MKSAIIALLATVAMAAPATEIVARQAKTVQACACANAAGQTTVGICLYGWGSTVNLDGQDYCFPYSPANDNKMPELFNTAKCGQDNSLFPTGVCKTVQVCPSVFGQQDIC